MITIALQNIEPVAEKMSAMLARARDLTPAMARIALALERSMLKTFREGGRPTRWPATRRMGWGATAKPLSITGTLRNITSEYTARTAQAGPTMASRKYAAIQNFGGTVKPVNVRALPVPLNEEARRAQAGVSSVRQIPGLTFLPREGKAPLLMKTAEKTSKKAGTKKGDMAPWFVLMRSVKIPARPFAVLQIEDLEQARRIMHDHVVNGPGGAA